MKKIIEWFHNKPDERNFFLVLLFFAITVVTLCTAENEFCWVITKTIIWIGSFFIAGFYLCVSIFLFTLSISWILWIYEKIRNRIRNLRNK